jgi:hypothetical protein
MLTSQNERIWGSVITRHGDHPSPDAELCVFAESVQGAGIAFGRR